jgi:putative ABC transport system ATP-binding protein
MNEKPSSQRVEDVLIRVSGLSKMYDDGVETIPVLKSIDLSVRRGEMAAIVGPSGCGKSTLMFILGLLLPPTEGEYTVEDRDVLGLDRSAQAEFRRHSVGFVFQACNLIENSTVWENLEFPLIYAGVQRKERAEQIHEALQKVRLEHRLHHRTNRLSGGEQQRVAVARALVNRPRIILADEPTGQLDHDHGQLMMDHFEAAVKDGDTTVIVVTHDPEIAARCKRAWYLRDGVLQEEPMG